MRAGLRFNVTVVVTVDYSGGSMVVTVDYWARFGRAMNCLPMGSFTPGDTRSKNFAEHSRDYIFDNNFYLNRFGGLDS